MATQRAAKIGRSEQLNSETKLLTLVLPEEESLNFTGGQYVIVNTNIPLPGGKIAKRAYSILSKDEDQSRFQIAVKKVGRGPGSNYMHETQIGAELVFSGPWGQFVVDDSQAGQGYTLVLATDTGITAALGLIQGIKFKSLAQNAQIVWMVESEKYFIPQSFVREICSANSLNFKAALIPSVNHPERLSKALEIFAQISVPQNIFLSGDGALLYPFKERLMTNGVQESQIKIECFFNNPFKKVSV